MAISPYDGESIISDEIRRIYAEAELRTIEAMAKRLARGEDDVQVWAQNKLRQLKNVKGEIDDEIIDYLKNHNEDVAEAIDLAYKKGQRSAEIGLNKLDELKVKGKFSAVNERTVNALAADITGKLDKTHTRILRTTDDVYRRAVGDAVRGVTTGTETRLQASQRVMNTFANKGVTGFVDKSGRSWNLSTYAEMAVRSASGNAALQGHMDRMKDNDRDLVIVSDHGDECEVCRPWERRILSISGTSKKYPSVAEARAAGLFHPNCRHTINAYIEGLTEDVGNKKAQSSTTGHEQRQKQRYNERQIRKWKRRKKAALDDREEQKAQNYITKWQKRQREFIDDTGRRRKYEREQINQAK